MAVELMGPLLHQINSTLPKSSQEESFRRMISVYGQRYSSEGDLLSLLDRLVDEEKITPTNTFALEHCLSENLTLKENLGNILKGFRSTKKQEIKEWNEYQPAEFIKRDLGWLETAFGERSCVVIWGVSGVGKTKLANEFMVSQRERQHVIVDLRGLNSVQALCVETLRKIGKIVSIDDATMMLVASVLAEQMSTNHMMLLFDNADDFVHYSGVGEDMTKNFASLVQNILLKSAGKLKILITSRSKSDHPESEKFLHQKELHALKNEEASYILRSTFARKPDEETNKLLPEAIKQCQNLPLNLKILGSALLDQGIRLADILSDVTRKARQWKLSSKKGEAPLSEAESLTYGVLAARFESLSDTTQLSAVALSLFARSFSFEAAVEVLKEFEISKVHLILEHLRGTNFVSLESDSMNDEIDRKYDIHPKVKEFLLENISYSKEVSSFYNRAKGRFISFFNKKLDSIGQYIDKDYMRACTEYQEESSNFDFIFKQAGNDLVLLGSYEKSQRVQLLFNGVLLPERRLEYFRNLADTAFKHGDHFLGTQYLSWQGMEESFLDPIKALKYTVLRIEHQVIKLERKCLVRDERKYTQVKALYHYTLGHVLYNVIHSNMSLDDCDAAIESLSESLHLMELLEPQGHIDTVRAYITLGNIYNIEEDIFRSNEKFDDINEALDRALDYYKMALDMRERLSSRRLHIDTPQILQNIGSIWYERCRIKKMFGEDYTESYQNAEMLLKEAINMEKDLKLYGLYRTSSKLINLGDLYRIQKEYDKAVECFTEALGIRRSSKGDHKDTVLVIYRLAVVKDTIGEYAEAVRYYKEAFEMEESLPVDFHSAVRRDIWKYLIEAYGYWEDMESNPPEKLRIRGEAEKFRKKILLIKKDQEEVEKRKPTGTPPHREFIAQWSSSGGIDIRSRSLHVELDSSSVRLSIPKDLALDEKMTELAVIPPDRYELFGQNLMSEVLGFGTHRFLGKTLDAPAFLEIRSEILNSNLDDSSEICVLQYDPVTDHWDRVEDIVVVPEKYYWFDRNDSVSTVYAWVSRCTYYRLAVQPKVHTLSVPVAGTIWRSWQDQKLALEFKPGTFSETAACHVKVLAPQVRISAKSGVLVTPAVNVQISKHLNHPVLLSLPFVDGYSEACSTLRVIKLPDDAYAEQGVDNAEWEEIDVPCTLDKARGIVSIEVNSFSWLWVVGTPVDYTLAALKTLLSSLYRGPVYDSVFHLYRGLQQLDQRVIALACARFDVIPNVDSRYTLVDSAPSQKRLLDSEKITVKVEGQFINTRTDKEDTIRFNKNVSEPWRVRVRETGLDDGRGGEVIMYDPQDVTVCSIPYLGDFQIISDSFDDKDEYKKRSSIRFLGLVLRRCGLEKIHICHGDFRNNLYRTGLAGDFVDELKLDADNKSRADITRKLFNRVTSLFADKELEPSWFEVFRDYLHPPSTRSNLKAVMTILRTTIQDKDRFANSVCGYNASFRGDRVRFCHQLILATGVQSPQKDDVPSLQLPQKDDVPSLLTQICETRCIMIELIRKVLLLKREGLQDEVDSFLEDVGVYVESQISVEY